MLVFLFVVNETLNAQWIQTNGPYEGRVNCLAISPNGYIFAGTYHGGVFRSTDKGSNWTESSNGLTTSTYVYSLHINASGHIFARTSDGFFRSADDGNNWINTGLDDIRSIVITSYSIHYTKLYDHQYWVSQSLFAETQTFLGSKRSIF